MGEVDGFEKDVQGEKLPDGRNDMCGTALAIISTIMGGGIVSIPFAYSVAGVWVGIGIQICVIIAIWISCVLYLETRSILQCNTNFSILANLCLGSISSVILNMLLVFAVFGILALYMILFSEIAISLIGGSYAADHILRHKAFYVTALCLLISPIVVRKKIQELKFSTYVLFFGVLSLVVLLTVLLGVNGTYETRLDEGTIDLVPESKHAAKQGSFEGVIDSLNIAVASQGFVIALFPIYASMARPARPQVMKSVTIALLFTMSTYTYLSFISISYFGQENVEPSIFNNIKNEEGIFPTLLMCLFLLIFFCNIPFVFFAGKIAFMAIVHQCCFLKKPRQQTDEELEEGVNGSINNQPQPSTSALNTTDPNMLQSFISMSIKGEVQPEDQLPYGIYLLSCFSYLIVVALAAIFIDDLTLIFGIIAGLAECSTVFILPSVFYLIASHREKTQWAAYNEAKSQGMPYKRPKTNRAAGPIGTFGVYLYMTAGITYFGISNYFTFAKIFG